MTPLRAANGPSWDQLAAVAAVPGLDALVADLHQTICARATRIAELDEPLEDSRQLPECCPHCDGDVNNSVTPSATGA